MCGIIGYVGRGACKPLLLQGLERLEYRGYDSAGIALLRGRRARLRPRGRQPPGPEGGRRHERLARHDRPRPHALGDPRRASPSENAHPLTGCDDGQLAIVLNGIVENYRELKESLQRRGPHVQLRDRRRGRRPPDRARTTTATSSRPSARPTRSSRATSRSSRSTTTTRACSSARGCQMPARRRRRRGRDVPRLDRSPRSSRETRRVQLIEDGEIVDDHARGRRALLRRRDGEVERETIEVDWDEESAEKGGYETFMLKEIYEQPEAVRETIGDRVRHGAARAREPRADRDEIRNLRRIVDRRLRHRVPRGRRRPLRDRGVGADPGRAGHRERVDLPQPGALEGHARDRHLAVGRDARHDRRDASSPASSARARSRSRT